MQPELFFETIASQKEKELPFVVYKKPNSTSCKALLQNDTTLHHTKSYTEPGFVFAPFDNTQDAILLQPDRQLVSEPIVSGVEQQKSKTSIQDKETIAGEAKSTHITLVNKALELLRDQELQKVVLSRQEKIKYSAINVLEKFQELCALYPTAMVYYWYHPKVGLWLGATPETLLKIHKNTLYTMALAGTQVYKGVVDVEWGKKELEEQQLVTDSIKKGLIPLVDQLEISDVYSHRAGNLLHLRTDVTALISEISLKQILTTLHPTPAVCGLPKEEAKRFILEQEGYDRAFYTGFFGELHLANTQAETKATETNLFVNLRCMQIKDRQVLLYIGGGITKDSIAEKEWEETVKKTNTMKSVL